MRVNYFPDHNATLSRNLEGLLQAVHDASFRTRSPLLNELQEVVDVGGDRIFQTEMQICYSDDIRAYDWIASVGTYFRRGNNVFFCARENVGRGERGPDMTPAKVEAYLRVCVSPELNHRLVVGR